MADGVNVRRVTCTDLLEHHRRRGKQQTTWDAFDFEKMDLISGSGSKDRQTELNVVNEEPLWDELFHLQREQPDTCDVHIFCRGGYIACHRVILQQSTFLDQILNITLRAHKPCCNNSITGISLDEDLHVLKTVVSLMYTGICHIADISEEQGVKDVLKLFQIDLNNIEKIPAPNTKMENFENDRIKTVHTNLYRDNDTVSVPDASSKLPAATTIQVSTTPSTKKLIVGNSNEAGPSSRSRMDLKRIEKIQHLHMRSEKSTDKIMKTTCSNQSHQHDISEPELPDGLEQLTSATTIQVGTTPATQSIMSDSPNEAGPSTRMHRSICAPSSTSSCGLPEMFKVLPGSLTSQRAMERIQQPIDDRKSSTSNTSNFGDSDDESGDEPASEMAHLPEFQKVAPGSLLPLQKQPRIVRKAYHSGRRGRGGENTDSGVYPINPTRKQVPIAAEGDEFDIPKGNYDDDFDDDVSLSGVKVEENVDEEMQTNSRSAERDVLDPPRPKRTRAKGISFNQANSSVVFLQLEDLKPHLGNANGKNSSAPGENEQPNFEDKIKVMHTERLDVVRLIDVGLRETKLTMKEIEALQETVRRGEKIPFCRSTCPPGYRYVFLDRQNDEEGTSITAGGSSVPTHNTAATALSAPPIQQPASAINNPSTSDFNPEFPFSPIPLFPNPKTVNNAKRTGAVTKPRPGPLSSKKRSEEELNCQTNDSDGDDQTVGLALDMTDSKLLKPKKTNGLAELNRSDDARVTGAKQGRKSQPGKYSDKTYASAPLEPRYCLCNEVSYGNMILCNSEDCPIKWFHFECVGIHWSPKGQWFCPKCIAFAPKRKGRKMAKSQA